LEYAQLGSSDLLISRVGFGCAVMGGWDYGSSSDAESVAAVHAALDVGVNFFDTADVYGLGHSEEVLSKALGSRQHDVVVATKFGVKWDAQGRTVRDSSPARIVKAVEGSLRRLKTDCISLYQVHWPDTSTPIEDTMEALDKCRVQGKIKHIGCCNFPSELIAAAQAVGRVESLQVPYNLGQLEMETLITTNAQRFTMGALCYNPLAQGLFTGKFTRESVFPKYDLRSRSALFQGDEFDLNLATVERLRKIGESYGKSPCQVAIRWVLENPAVTSALSGIRTVAQALENIGGVGWRMDTEASAFLRGDSRPQRRL
jgi:aryl-alcohol dehydrogenase-like predicted oxidoreductase